jgi:hypothetical protein
VEEEEGCRGEQCCKLAPRGHSLPPPSKLYRLHLPLAATSSELPENTPRYILLSYQLSHKDGRVSFPLVLLFWCPETSSVEMSTLYASALSSLSVQSDVGKVVEFREGRVERKVLEQRLGA